MLIDFHTHAFPHALAERAIAKLESVSGRVSCTNGTAEDLEGKMRQWGADRHLILHIATRPGSQRKVNDFAACLQSGTVYCFGSVHPDDEERLTELRRIKELGLRGVKLHPDYQEFMVDDEKMFPIYETCAKLALPVAFHTGWDPLSPCLVHCPPKALRRVAERFPELTIIGAHLGGMCRYDEVMEHIVGLKNVYLDTAVSSVYCPQERFAEIIRAHGVKRVLFGSDCPWSNTIDELNFLKQAHFSPEEMEQICWKNAAEMLNLTDL